MPKAREKRPPRLRVFMDGACFLDMPLEFVTDVAQRRRDRTIDIRFSGVDRTVGMPWPLHPPHYDKGTK